MNQNMKRAIELALQNVEQGGQPFGAVLVKGDEVLGEGVNELHRKHDISGHAEMIAIRQAQEKLQTNDLSECTMYASGQPCAMCWTAMQFAGLTDIYYAQSVDDAEQVGLGKSKQLYSMLQHGNLHMHHVGVGDEQDPMRKWQEMNR